MITDIVRNVAGDKAEVSGLIGEGIDPHLYSPARNDVVALSQADIIFYNGLMLEGKMGDLFVESSVSDKYVRALVEGTQARGWDVVIGGELFSDAMGPGGCLRGHLHRDDRP